MICFQNYSWWVDTIVKPKFNNPAYIRGEKNSQLNCYAVQGWGLKRKPGKILLMLHTHLPAGAYWSAKLHWAQDDSLKPLFWWSNSRPHLKRHLGLPFVSSLLMIQQVSSLSLWPVAIWVLNFPQAWGDLFFLTVFSPPLKSNEVWPYRRSNTK